MKRLMSLWLAALLLAAQPAQGVVLVGFGQVAGGSSTNVGYSTIGATQTASTSANRALAVGSFTAPTGTITEIHAWLDNTASATAYDVILGVYDISWNLIATGTVNVAALAENYDAAVTGLNVAISSGSYRIAVFPQSTTFRYHSDTDAGVTWYYRDAVTYGSLPDPLPTPSTVASRKMSAWFVVE